LCYNYYNLEFAIYFKHEVIIFFPFTLLPLEEVTDLITVLFFLNVYIGVEC